jgi:hypothetical protein
MGINRGCTNSSGSIVISDSEVDLVGLGDVTVGATQVLIDSGGEITSEFRIRADTGNTGTIYIGKTGVLADGTNDFVRLSAGEEISLGYNDIVNKLYAISDVAAQKINVGMIITV